MAPPAASTPQDKWMTDPNIGVKVADYPPPSDSGAAECPKPPGLANANPDKQSQAFKAAFETQYNAINGHLEYTTENAEEALNKPFVARRDALPGAYQAAMGQVDPDDEKKAKAAIDKVLATAKALNAEVAKFRATAEKAFNDWKSRQPKFDEAAQHVQELETWGDAKAAALRGLADGIAKMAGTRKYAAASTTFDQFQSKLKPIYDEYLKQKAAKEKYDAAMEQLKPKLEGTQISCYKKLEPLQKTIGGLQGQMDKDVEAKNYVQALKLSGDLAPKADEFLNKKKDMDDRKKEYEDLVAAMDGKNPGPVKIPAKFEPMEKDMDAIRKQMEAAATAEDFDKALKFGRDLSQKYDVYLEDLKQELKKEQDYDDAKAKIEPRMPKATPENPKLEPMAAELEKIDKQMEAAAEKEDYDKALSIANDLSVKLDAYEAAVEEIEKKKEAYEKFLEPLKERLEKVAEAKGGKQSVLQKEILAMQKKMEEEAQKGEYDEASSVCVQLPAKLDAYEEATGGGKKNSIGGSFPFAEHPLAKFHATKYVEGEVIVSGSVKYGLSKAEDAGGDLTNDEAKSALETYLDELWKEAEPGWQDETGEGLTYNKSKGVASLDVGLSVKSKDMGPFKIEVAPLEIPLMTWDKKKGLSGPKIVSKASLVVPVFKHAVKGIDLEIAIVGTVALELKPDYLAIGETLLEKFGPEVGGAAAPVVGGIVGGIALCAATMAAIDALEEQGKDAAAICQEGARRLRDYAKSYGSAIRGTPGSNALGNQDADAYLKWIMKTVPGTTRNDAIEMCKESDQKYEELAYAKLLPQMREDVRKAYVKKHDIMGEDSNFRICLNEFLGEDTHY